MKSRVRSLGLFGFATLSLLFTLSIPDSVSATPGDSLRRVIVPRPSTSGVGIGIAVDCYGVLYYTNTYMDTLFWMDAFGNHLGQVPLTESDSGNPISFGAISWDESRGVLWAGTIYSGCPGSIYTVNPSTGVATYKFSAVNWTVCFIDGVAYDTEPAPNGSVWVSDDVSCVIDRLDAVTGLPLPGSPLTPIDSLSNPLCSISGVAVAKGNELYIGQNGFGNIIRIDKTTGVVVSFFSTIGGRDEDLECDDINFAPLEAIWSKDAYDNSVTAIELETGTCFCAGTGNSEYDSRNTHPLVASLFQNYPNPFHSTTLIRYTIPGIRGQGSGISGGGKLPVRLTIYDITGRLVETLVDENQEPGIYQLPISKHQLPGSGIYFYRLTAGESISTKKFVLLK